MAAEEAKENLDVNKPDTKFCFIQEPSTEPHQQLVVQEDGRRKAAMNILNPDSGLGEREGGREGGRVEDHASHQGCIYLHTM